ncbi:hypothetical protein PAL_GLEAN10020989 [Pteropus alecto]|uniref:Uncharacterized protein n=1 Tax=Pteropus alecto TaxID=9402 RepID=L5K6J3_PTEAL|nr:hypothetical protein PAL_GLEAN10020989 [Pteropus alecto]
MPAGSSVHLFQTEGSGLVSARLSPQEEDSGKGKAPLPYHDKESQTEGQDRLLGKILKPRRRSGDSGGRNGPLAEVPGLAAERAAEPQYVAVPAAWPGAELLEERQRRPDKVNRVA